MSTKEKLNKKIARQIRKEIAEAIHASSTGRKFPVCFQQIK